MSLTDCVLAKTCGEDPAGGPRDCDQPLAVYIEYTDRNGCDLASALCHQHAAALRAGADVWEESGEPWDARPYVVTHWRSL